MSLLPACTTLDPSHGSLEGGSCGSASPAPDIGPWSADAALFEQRVLELSNEERAQGGCCGARCFEPSAALTLDQNLQVSARLHARDMAIRDFFSHETPDGDTMVDRVHAAGFAGCAAGENIAQGQQSPEQVVESWMSSEGHCANILSSDFTALGVGYFDQESQPQRHLWVQNFGG
ncbi:MAG TPA: CAP domain-containing protein [Polyangiaceae bacterium]|nr:CAP domain-containing protein [Polyangiaceae bacterium]